MESMTPAVPYNITTGVAVYYSPTIICGIDRYI